MKRVVLIICFFGEVPWYFNYFLKSAEFNKTIDFLLFTDQTFSERLPPNFNKINTSLEDIRVLAETNLKCKISLNFPYKLCDIRPAFGVIFKTYISNYDFWGYCDIDLIFGDIRSFVNENTLENYDVISARSEYLSGFFSLYRNTDYINYLFMKNDGYKETFISDQYMNFDECNHKHWELLSTCTTLSDLEFNQENMTRILLEEIKNNKIKVSFKQLALEFLPGDIVWENGKLTFAEKFDFLLYHLIQFKTITDTNESVVWNCLPNKFYIGYHKFSLHQK